MYRAALISVLCLPTLALAAPRTFADLANIVTNLINGGIGVVLVLGIVVFFYGVVSHTAQGGSANFEKLRTQLLWGLIALFVMFSVWGILALVRNTLFGGGGYSLDSSSKEVLCDKAADCLKP